MENIKETDRNSKAADNWLKDKISINPSLSIALHKLYQAYCQDLINEGMLPLTKRGFNKRVKLTFQRFLLEGRILIINRGGLVYKGLGYEYQ